MMMNAGSDAAFAHLPRAPRNSIQYNLSSIQYYLTSIQYYLTSIQYYLSSIQYYLSSIQYYLTSIQYYLSSIQYYLSSIQYYLSSIQYYLSSIQYYLSSIQYYLINPILSRLSTLTRPLVTYLSLPTIPALCSHSPNLIQHREALHLCLDSRRLYPRLVSTNSSTRALAPSMIIKTAAPSANVSSLDHRTRTRTSRHR